MEHLTLWLPIPNITPPPQTPPVNSRFSGCVWKGMQLLVHPSAPLAGDRWARFLRSAGLNLCSPPRDLWTPSRSTHAHTCPAHFLLAWAHALRAWLVSLKKEIRLNHFVVRLTTSALPGELPLKGFRSLNPAASLQWPHSGAFPFLKGEKVGSEAVWPNHVVELVPALALYVSS